jgi:NAD(P)-dependent dehydrogenase (short-subunit alcohol dehydrogenase family)
LSRTILITGGSGKFGRVLVAHFLAAGDTVVTTCRSDQSRVSLQSEYSGIERDRFHVVQTDLTRANQAEELAAALRELRLAPDCLVNNARIVPYELTMELVEAQGSALRRIVNIGSMYGLVAANPSLYTDPVRQSPIHYGVAKAALTHLTKELAVRLAGRGIDVNCVAYGGVEGRVDEAFKARYGKLCPKGRMLREDEIAGPVAWLLSDNCSGMTGQTLAVDGGWSVW